MKTHRAESQKTDTTHRTHSSDNTNISAPNYSQNNEIGHILRGPGQVDIKETLSPHEISEGLIQRELGEQASETEGTPAGTLRRFPGETQNLYDRRLRVISYIPRAIQRIRDRLIRGSSGLFRFESHNSATGRISAGGPGSDWPPETLFARRQRLERFITDLGDVLNQLETGPIPPGWVQVLEREAAAEAASQPEFGGFGQVVEDIIIFYLQVAQATGIPVDTRDINLFYIVAQPAVRGRHAPYYPTSINIIIPDSRHPARVVRVTSSERIDLDQPDRGSGSSDTDIIPVFRDEQGYFYFSSRGQVRLDRRP